MTSSSSIRQMHVFMWMNCLTMLVFAFINISVVKSKYRKFIRWKYISGTWQDTMKHWNMNMVSWCIFWTLTHNGTSQQFSFEKIFGEICNFCPLCAHKMNEIDLQSKNEPNSKLTTRMEYDLCAVNILNWYLVNLIYVKTGNQLFLE